MNNTVTITDKSGGRVEHSSVIVNFVAMVKGQLRNTLCRVFSDNVQYKWQLGDMERIFAPDASINCQVKNRKGDCITNSPIFVMEVLSAVTEKIDRIEKMEIYTAQEIPEYWIVDWEEKKVEIYLLDYVDGRPKYFLCEVVTADNKDKLRIISMQKVRVDFDELFDTAF